MKKNLPKLPRGAKILFMYQSNEYINLVSVDGKEVTFYLWDGVSENTAHIMKFPRYWLKSLKTNNK